jgi:hypothetical protein
MYPPPRLPNPTHHRHIHAMKVIRRQKRFFRQAMDIECVLASVVKMIDHVVEHALNALGVGFAGDGFHSLTLSYPNASNLSVMGLTWIAVFAVR